MAEAFGRELVSARKFKGITLEQISDATKIQLRYLEAMESGHWDILPQPYMEAFLKAYADMVGMNVPKVMKMFRDLRRQMLAIESPDEEFAPEPVPTQPLINKPKPKSSAGWIISGILILAGAAVALFIIFKPQLLRRSAPVDETREVSPDSIPISMTAETSIRDTIFSPDSAASPLDSAVAPSDSTSVPPDSAERVESMPRANNSPVEIPVGVNLLARARQRCWLRAVLDNEEIKETILSAGDSLMLRAKNQVELLVGNAGGLELEMDGESLGILGPVGRAVTIVINPDGIKSQRLGRPSSNPDLSASP